MLRAPPCSYRGNVHSQAKSGQTVIFAGLITKSKSTITRRAPYLSDIPILGNLFRFDTSRPGNGNGGHVYGTGLPEEQKLSLIEYLKTL